VFIRDCDGVGFERGERCETLFEFGNRDLFEISIS
jgi:hypothetical protein